MAILLGDLQAAIAAFQKEAFLLISLRHLALPVIRDFFSRSEKRWHLVLDYIEGRNLKYIVDQRGPDSGSVLDLAEQLCGILDYLHSQNPGTKCYISMDKTGEGEFGTPVEFVTE